MENANVVKTAHGVIIATKHVTQSVICATRRMVVARGVHQDIGESLVTRNVTQIVTVALWMVVVASSVKMVIGE